MDITDFTTPPERLANQRVALLLREHYVAEVLELEARVRDLEDERDTYRFWWTKTLAALQELTAQHERRHDDLQRLHDELRDLRAMVVAESCDDAVAVLGAETYRAVRASLAGTAPAPETIQ